MPEEEVVVVHPDSAFEEKTDGTRVTGQRVIVDGDLDKEITERDPVAGASSEAPASSGIPSAVRQQGAAIPATEDQEETPLADRVLPQKQSTQP